MDKNVIKTFAVESRRKMIESVKFQASLLGITAVGIKEPISKAEGMETYDYGAGQHTIYDEDIKKRESLVSEINNKGFENVVEEVAYTWFNRIIAIRFMEVNDYLPERTRVLSSETEGKIEPDIITEAFDLDLDLSDEDREKIFKLKNDTKLDELFQFLFIKQCNKLNRILPGLFEKTDDYMELLLDIKFTEDGGVIRQLVDNISEDDFGEQVEIIGWLYQYYISEKKNEVINIYKGNIKKEDIPAATQLFTTDWVVKYMVDNSLGRYWIERNHSSRLANTLEFYLGEAKQPEEVQFKLNLIRKDSIQIEDLKFLDPCMGSGHILVYAFDVFFEIYKELGYQNNDIPNLILKNNIFGLDIDDRAFQLAYFAIMMKARKYDRKIFKKEIKPNIYSIQESEKISDDVISFINTNNSKLAEKVKYLKHTFKSGKEFGSLIQVKNIDYDKMLEEIELILSKNRNKLTDIVILDIIEKNVVTLINQAKILSQKYDIVVTNPPYMNKFEKSFKDFAKEFYNDYSKDLFSMFIFRNFCFCKKNGYSGFMTPFVWMFIKNFEKLREFIINKKNISTLIQLEYSAFSEATVPICTFVLSNNFIDESYLGTYLKLSDFTGGMDVQKEKVLNAIDNECDYLYNSSISKFSNIPGCPIAYWADKHVFEAFKNGTPLNKVGDVKQGLATADNNRFLRFWYEVNYNKIGFDVGSCDESINSNLKWFPYNKGGSFRKWYGNQEYVINWENDGLELRNFKKAVLRNSNFYFQESIGWSSLSSGNIGFRFYPKGFLFDTKGSSVFVEKNEFSFIFAFLNSNICQSILNILAPTIDYSVGSVSNLPLIFDYYEFENKIKIYCS